MSEKVLPIKELRIKLGMNQTDLAIAAGLTPAAISQFESGIRRPSFHTLKKLSDALKVTTDYILGKQERGYGDLLADPKMEEMLTGMLDLSDKDKDTLYDYFRFIQKRHYSQ